MAAESNYRVITGFVQFEPREGEAGGKAVRNITIKQTGFKDQSVRVSATVWPSHAHVPLAKGDFVAVEGKYTQNTGTNKDGEKVTYHNLSVSNLIVLGKGDTGAEVEVENAAPAEDDEIPF